MSPALPYKLARLGDIGRGIRAARRGTELESNAARLHQHQRERTDAIVRHAIARSPFYRARLKQRVPTTGHVELERLPELDKTTMMDNFDALVTDRRLRVEELLAYVERAQSDELLPGGYRVMATSGSSGSKGLFVYDREAWAAVVGMFFRYSDIAGLKLRIPRAKVAVIGGALPTHMTSRVAQTIAIGVHDMLRLDVAGPIPELVAELNRFRPDFVHTYPTIGALLADEQLAGRLDIRPHAMATSSELRTAEMTGRMVDAFGVRPLDLYAMTEGLWGCECGQGEGIHLFEDVTCVENVDADGRPVPDGEPGDRLLLTSLVNRTQPLIRFEVPDVVVLDSAPCPCGRATRRIVSLEGRRDDVIYMHGGGGRVAVHPMQFASVSKDADVREFQVVQEGQRLRVRVVLREDASAEEVVARVASGLTERLEKLGVFDAAAVAVEPCGRLPRSAANGGGKLKVVVADPAA